MKNTVRVAALLFLFHLTTGFIFMNGPLHDDMEDLTQPTPKSNPGPTPKPLPALVALDQKPASALSQDETKNACEHLFSAQASQLLTLSTTERKVVEAYDKLIGELSSMRLSTPELETMLQTGEYFGIAEEGPSHKSHLSSGLKQLGLGVQKMKTPEPVLSAIRETLDVRVRTAKQAAQQQKRARKIAERPEELGWIPYPVTGNEAITLSASGQLVYVSSSVSFSVNLKELPFRPENHRPLPALSIAMQARIQHLKSARVDDQSQVTLVDPRGVLVTYDTDAHSPRLGSVLMPREPESIFPVHDGGELAFIEATPGGFFRENHQKLKLTRKGQQSKEEQALLPICTLKTTSPLKDALRLKQHWPMVLGLVTKENELWIWEAYETKAIRVLKALPSAITAFSPSSTLFSRLAEDGNLSVHDSKTGALLMPATQVLDPASRNSVKRFLLSNTGKHLAVIIDKKLSIIDTATARRAELDEPVHNLNAVQFTADGTEVIALTSDGVIRRRAIEDLFEE